MSFIKKIFSIENKKEHKRITILGINCYIFSTKNAYKILKQNMEKEAKSRIKLEKFLKDINNEVKFIKSYEYKNIYDIFRFYGISEALLDRLNYLSESVFAWKYYNKKIWLIYIACLIEKKENIKALDILKKYIYFNNLDDIEHFYLVSYFAHNNGYTNELIEKSSKVYGKLLEAKENDLLKKALTNKTIAIVGNAPNMIGSNKGQEIDSHDVVIRFNNFTTKGYEGDVGEKTDIWCCGLNSDIEEKELPFKIVLYADNIIRRCVPNNEILFNALMRGSEICCCTNEYTDELRQKINFNPTLGANLIYNIYKLFGSFDNVDFYGFNFLQQNYDNYCLHYFNDRELKEELLRKTTHNFYLEAKFLSNLINNVKSIKK